jgi:cytochrome d ubiquinol oxidase subunit I
MVGIGTFLIALTLWYWLRRRAREERMTLLALAAAGPLALAANELGWMVTELGRQPWVIYGVLRTRAAITPAGGIGLAFSGFTVLYVLLAGGTVWLLRRLATGAPAVLVRPAGLAAAA